MVPRLQQKARKIPEIPLLHGLRQHLAVVGQLNRISIPGRFNSPIRPVFTEIINGSRNILGPRYEILSWRPSQVPIQRGFPAGVIFSLCSRRYFTIHIHTPTLALSDVTHNKKEPGGSFLQNGWVREPDLVVHASHAHSTHTAGHTAACGPLLLRDLDDQRTH